MKCPFCSSTDDKVIDSRWSKSAETIRRRRECLTCGRRYTTYERIEEIPYMVIKKGCHREIFDRQKLLSGLMKACEKRPISVAQLSEIVDDIERELIDAPEREIETSVIGEKVMKFLHDIDEVAYVRFASVYRQFKDINEFMEELNNLLQQKDKK